MFDDQINTEEAYIEMVFDSNEEEGSNINLGTVGILGIVIGVIFVILVLIGIFVTVVVFGINRS